MKYAQHLRPFEMWAGERPIESITAQEIELDFLGTWSQTVSAATLRNRIAALRSLFDFCERLDYLDKNPMRRIESPPRDETMGNRLRPEQDVALQEAIATPVERIVIMLLRFSGLRVSEACALRWSDLDLDAGTLTVRKSKTSAGRRTIPIPTALIPCLRVWRERLEAQGLYASDGYLLATKYGTPMWPQFATRQGPVPFLSRRGLRRNAGGRARVVHHSSIERQPCDGRRGLHGRLGGADGPGCCALNALQVPHDVVAAAPEQVV